MTSVARVKLWGTPIGIVALEDGASAASFEYDSRFVRSGIEVAPLMMPLSSQVYRFPGLPYEAFRGLPGMLADSLPDKFGNAVIDDWLRARGRSGSSLNAVERLCYTGSRGMGALEFEPATGPSSRVRDSIEVAALAQLAQQILSRREEAHVNSDDVTKQQILQVGTSAGGARAKAIIAWNEETGDIRSGQIDAGPGYGYWIIKFDGVGGDGGKEESGGVGYSKVEYAYYLMALAANIEMSESRLFKAAGQTHFVTRRFDRVGEAGEKLHAQTLGAIAHLDLNDPNSSSYEQAVQVMRRLRLGQDEVEQFFRRTAFNIMARNQDDHVKNISFLMDKTGAWRLAPAYDMTYAYNPAGAWTGRHQMSANGKREGFARADLMETAEHMSVPPARARAVLSDVAEAVELWPQFAERAGVPEDKASAIGRAHAIM